MTSHLLWIIVDSTYRSHEMLHYTWRAPELSKRNVLRSILCWYTEYPENYINNILSSNRCDNGAVCFPLLAQWGTDTQAAGTVLYNLCGIYINRHILSNTYQVSFLLTLSVSCCRESPCKSGLLEWSLRPAELPLSPAHFLSLCTVITLLLQVNSLRK